MPNILCRFHELMAAATRAEPLRRADHDNRDWIPPVISCADLASPYFLSMADRDAGWYQDHQRSF